MHAEGGHHQTHKGNNDDTNDDGYSAIGHLGKELPPYHCTHHPIAQVCQNVQTAAKFAKVKPHEVSRHDLSGKYELSVHVLNLYPCA